MSRRSTKTRSRNKKEPSFIIDKFLNEGLMGKVFLVHKGRKQYAMKIEYITGKDDRYLKNELQFHQDVSRHYPDQFTQLISSRIIYNCKAEAPPTRDWLTKHELDWLNQLRSSGVCVEKVYSLVDTTLDKVPLEHMSLPQLYSALIQMLYIVYLFESHNYVHGDFHHGNIGILHVPKKKHVQIFEHSIPTFGSLYQAIDYGGVLHKNRASKTHLYQQREDVTEYQHFRDHSIVDKQGIISSMYSEKPFWDFIDKYHVPMKSYEHDLDLILRQEEMNTIKPLSKHSYVRFDLFKLLFPKQFQQLILGSYFKKTISLPMRIPLEDILFCYINLDNTKLIIEYLIQRLYNLL